MYFNAPQLRPDSLLREYMKWRQNLGVMFPGAAPMVQAPKVGDPNVVIEGARPVLEQEERAARQRAASQFAKLGIPVSSAYMERLGRVAGETATKMADITNRYMFEAAQKQAELELQAALANQRAQLEIMQSAAGTAERLFEKLVDYNIEKAREQESIRLAEEKCARVAGYGTPAYYECLAKIFGAGTMDFGHDFEMAKRKCNQYAQTDPAAYKRCLESLVGIRPEEKDQLAEAERKCKAYAGGNLEAYKRCMESLLGVRPPEKDPLAEAERKCRAYAGGNPEAYKRCMESLLGVRPPEKEKEPKCDATNPEVNCVFYKPNGTTSVVRMCIRECRAAGGYPQ